MNVYVLLCVYLPISADMYAPAQTHGYTPANAHFSLQGLFLARVSYIIRVTLGRTQTLSLALSLCLYLSPSFPPYSSFVCVWVVGRWDRGFLKCIFCDAVTMFKCLCACSLELLNIDDAIAWPVHTEHLTNTLWISITLFVHLKAYTHMRILWPHDFESIAMFGMEYYILFLK